MSYRQEIVGDTFIDALCRPILADCRKVSFYAIQPVPVRAECVIAREYQRNYATLCK